MMAVVASRRPDRCARPHRCGCSDRSAAGSARCSGSCCYPGASVETASAALPPSPRRCRPPTFHRPSVLRIRARRARGRRRSERHTLWRRDRRSTLRRLSPWARVMPSASASAPVRKKACAREAPDLTTTVDVAAMAGVSVAPSPVRSARSRPGLALPWELLWVPARIHRGQRGRRRFRSRRQPRRHC